MKNRKFEFILVTLLFSAFILVVACGYMNAKVQRLEEVVEEKPVCKDVDWRFIECHLPENNCIVLDKFGDAMTCEEFYLNHL